VTVDYRCTNRARLFSAIGADHRRNSRNVNPAFSEIITPIGLPIELALEPMFVAKTA